MGGGLLIIVQRLGVRQPSSRGNALRACEQAAVAALAALDNERRAEQASERTCNESIRGQRYHRLLRWPPTRAGHRPLCHHQMANRAIQSGSQHSTRLPQRQPSKRRITFAPPRATNQRLARPRLR